MDRRAVILRHLETALSASVEGLAFRLNVSPRTVASDIEHLNAALGSAGSVRLRDGRYRLLVVDEQRFQSVRTSLLTQNSSFNDLDRRTSYLAARLFRADIPLRAEELAAAMSVGRTTVTADLARLREQLASYTLGIEGRTHVGLRAIGPELEWRQFILQRAFDAAYGDYGLDEEIALDVAHTGDQRLLNPDTVANVLRWCTVMIAAPQRASSRAAAAALRRPCGDACARLCARGRPACGTPSRGGVSSRGGAVLEPARGRHADARGRTRPGRPDRRR